MESRVLECSYAWRQVCETHFGELRHDSIELDSELSEYCRTQLASRIKRLIWKEFNHRPPPGPFAEASACSPDARSGCVCSPDARSCCVAVDSVVHKFCSGPGQSLEPNLNSMSRIPCFIAVRGIAAHSARCFLPGEDRHGVREDNWLTVGVWLRHRSRQGWGCGCGIAAGSGGQIY